LAENSKSKPLRFSEWEKFLGNDKLDDSIIVVYQHGNQGKSWNEMLKEKTSYLKGKEICPEYSVAVMFKNYNIGFFIFAKDPKKFDQIKAKTTYELQKLKV
jgi:hypothetical protein